MSARPTQLVHGTCHHDCPDSCGWQVTVDDGKAVQLRGNPEHPFSKGELCPKVNRFLDRVYSPDRVLYPLRRVGAKGEGRFERISWDDALTEIADRWRDIIDIDGAEALLPYVSAGNQGLLALFYADRLWNHLGATRVTGSLCGAAASEGVAITNGTRKSIDPIDLVHSRLIIIWGANTRLTNRHQWPFIEEARAAGAQIIVIDPLRTITADSADWFLQPLPGTDIALMLAMMHILVRDGLVDHEWVQAHTVGYDELVEHVAEWTPARAATVTGLDIADIERLTHLYGTVQPAAIRTLIGAEHHENGAMFFRTLTCLPALTGAWRHVGGGYTRSVSFWTNQVFDHAALTRPDLLAGRNTRSIVMPQLGRVLLGDPAVLQGPPIRSVLFQGVNAMVSVPGTEEVRRGLERDDLFTIVHEQFLTDTARYADLVLPATTQIEALDVVTAWGHLNIGWNEPAIEPLGEAVSNSELFRRIAAALGCTEPALFDDDLTALRSALPALDLDLLRREAFIRVPYPADHLPLAEPDERIQLVTERLESAGLPALPTYIAPTEDRFADAHPFALLTPKHHTRFINSSYSHLPNHGDREGGPFVEVCAADAATLGLDDGVPARVWNDRASLEVPVRVSERVRPGVVAIPWGWWSEHHGGGPVANSLTNTTLTDWGGGVAYSDTRVSLARA